MSKILAEAIPPSDCESCRGIRVMRKSPTALCAMHIAAQIDCAGDLWSVILNWMNMLDTGDERRRVRRLIRRRLAHPEMGGHPETRTVEAVSRIRPRLQRPPCMSCGSSYGTHDPMTGESKSCDGYIPVK